MFESIIIRPNSSRKHPLDYGQLIENLFFYQHTVAHIGRNEIKSLFDLADVDVLVELLKNPSLSIYYNNSHVGIGNQNEIRFVDSFGLAQLDLEKELYEESFNHRGDKLRSKKFAQKLSHLLKIYQLPKRFNEVMNTELQDSEFRDKILKETLKYYQPYLKLDDIQYELEYLDEYNFKLHTNFESIGVDPKMVSVDSPILALINACEDLHVAGESTSDILLPDFNSKMLQVKINKTIERTLKSQKEIEVFNHYNYDESWALREAINSKRIHVKAVLPILRKASKYKEWLKDLPESENLLFEYIAKVEEKNILEKLPSKAIRFYIYNGLSIILGQVNPAAGIPLSLGLSAFDTFLLEKMIKRWKPNQFVEAELVPLIKDKKK